MSLDISFYRTSAGKDREGNIHVRPRSVEQYVTGAGGYFAQHGFFESPIVSRVQTFGNIAHILCSYESRNAPGEAPFARGINFETRASWPPTMDKQERIGLERAIAEGVADVLLSGIYQHSGCSVALVEVRWDDICSSEAAFMKAANSAMRDLLAAQWKVIIKKQQ